MAKRDDEPTTARIQTPNVSFSVRPDEVSNNRPGRAVLPLPCRTSDVKPLSHVRSTLIKFSLDQVAARGLLEPYYAKLDAAHREALTGLVAGHWLEAAAGHAHYAAIDALALPEQETFEMGRFLVTALATTLLSRTRLAVSSPWDLFAVLGTVWERTCQGGGIAVYEWGSELARIDFVAVPTLALPYCRTAMRGLLQGLLAQTVPGVRVQDVPRRGSIVTYAATWSA